MSQTILGVDLGSYSVKVVRVLRKTQEFEITHFIEEILDPNPRLTHIDQLAAAFRKIFDEHILTSDVVCMSIPGHLMSSRILKIPSTNLKKISQGVEFQLEEYIPFPIEDLFTDFHVLNQVDNMSEVLTVYLAESKLAEYIGLLESHDLDPKYLGADFTDLAAVAYSSFVSHDDLYAICDIGHYKTNLLIMEKQQLRYVRTIGIGGYHFTRAIQRAYNLNHEKAEAMKMSRGKLHLRSEESDQLSRIMSKVATELVSSIKQTVLGSKLLREKGPLAAIYCCGGGSKLSGIREFMSFHLRLNVFELESLNFFKHDIEDVDETNEVIAQALGTAIKPIYSYKVPRINFRKGPYAYKQDLQFLTGELKSVGAFLGVIIILVVGYYFYARHHYEGRIIDLTKKIERVIEKDFKNEITVSTGRNKDEKMASGSLLKTYSTDIKKKVTALKNQLPSASQKQVNIISVMEDFSSALPKKTEVNFSVVSFNYTGELLKLECVTTDPDNKDKVVNALQASKLFANIEPGSISPKPGNVFQFSMKIQLKTKKDDGEDS